MPHRKDKFGRPIKHSNLDEQRRKEEETRRKIASGEIQTAESIQERQREKANITRRPKPKSEEEILETERVRDLVVPDQETPQGDGIETPQGDPSFFDKLTTPLDPRFREGGELEGQEDIFDIKQIGSELLDASGKAALFAPAISGAALTGGAASVGFLTRAFARTGAKAGAQAAKGAARGSRALGTSPRSLGTNPRATKIAKDTVDVLQAPARAAVIKNKITLTNGLIVAGIFGLNKGAITNVVTGNIGRLESETSKLGEQLTKIPEAHRKGFAKDDEGNIFEYTDAIALKEVEGIKQTLFESQRVLQTAGIRGTVLKLSGRYRTTQSEIDKQLREVGVAEGKILESIANPSPAIENTRDLFRQFTLEAEEE